MVYTITVHLYCNDAPESIPRLKAKLVEAAGVYRKDHETLDWLVMQDVKDPRAFTIVERFETEEVRKIILGGRTFDSRCVLNSRVSKQSQKYHLENPYWKTFDPAVLPLLDRPMDLRRHEEMEVMI